MNLCGGLTWECGFDYNTTIVKSAFSKDNQQAFGKIKQAVEECFEQDTSKTVQNFSYCFRRDERMKLSCGKAHSLETPQRNLR